MAETEKKCTIFNPDFSFEFLTKIHIKEIREQSREYANRLQSCCFKKWLAIGTEKGNIHLLSLKDLKPRKVLYGEPWISSLENCKGLVWLSGISRSLICLRVKDNKKIFHTNCNTEISDYDGNGVQIFKEKVNRFFFFNSGYSRIRVISSLQKKVILRENMLQKMQIGGEKEDSMNQFCVDDVLGNIWFTYLYDENLYVYSYLRRKMVKVIRVYNPKLRKIHKNLTFAINLTLQPHYGYAVSHYSLKIPKAENIDVFCLYKCVEYKEKKKDSIAIKLDKQIYTSKKNEY